MATAKNGLQFDDYEQFNIIRIAQDSEDRALGEDHIDDIGARTFAARHPEFYCCDENAALLRERLDEYGDNLPATTRNLEIVYTELREEGKLKALPAPAVPEVDTSRGVIQVRTDVLLEYQTPSDEAAILAKLRDDTNLSDHARKNRDERLRLLAGEQRRSLASANLYR
jgi:hypothetical protein